MGMFRSFSDPAAGVSEPPGDFKSNYRHLKQLINKALKEGTPLEELCLVPKNPTQGKPRQLSRQDLVSLLHIIRRIKVQYQALLESPVPRELERDIRMKTPQERLPWETEALEKVDQWQRDVETVRYQVRSELNDHLNSEFFRGV
jgi:hypothetical protein